MKVRHFTNAIGIWFLVVLAGLATASAQDLDWSNEDLPEYIEAFGFVDADYDGPALDGVYVADQRTSVAPTDQVCDSYNCLHCRYKLTGDWSGCRSCIQQHGVIYQGRLTQFFFGVVDGIQAPVRPEFAALGIAGGDQFEYTGNSQHDFVVDLNKLAGLPQAKFVVTLENIWGRFRNVSLETGASTPAIFNAFMPVDPEANAIPRVTNFLFVQPVSENLILTVGKTRLAGTADRNIFAGGDGSDQFLNQTFVANPLFVSQLPLSTFALVAVMPREWGNVSVSVIDPLERSTTFMDFGTLFSSGALIIGQVKVRTNFFGKPGEHHIGGNYKKVDLVDLQFSPRPPTYPYPPAPQGTPKFLTRPESYTVYYGFDQYLAVYDRASGGNTPRILRDDPAGWGVFGRAGISDDGSGNPNFSGWHVSAGIGGDSPLTSRRGTGDRFGIGYGFTATSTEWGAPARALFGPRDSQAFEAYYRYHWNPSMSISPDVQWIRGKLGGLTVGRDAFVYGFRMNIRL